MAKDLVFWDFHEPLFVDAVFSKKISECYLFTHSVLTITMMTTIQKGTNIAKLTSKPLAMSPSSLTRLGAIEHSPFFVELG